VLAYELVFTLTVFKGLTGKTFAVDDKIVIRNRQSGILYKDEAAQGQVNKVTDITLFKNEELTSTETATTSKQIKQPAISDIQVFIKKEDSSLDCINIKYMKRMTVLYLINSFACIYVIRFNHKKYYNDLLSCYGTINITLIDFLM